MRVLLALLLAGTTAIADDRRTMRDYAGLVRRAVQKDGVDYDLLRRERPVLEAVRAMATETTADLINLYNATILCEVLDGRSPKEACAQIKKFEATITDPRIHFALHRASRSSPPLQFFRGNTLDEDLTQTVRVFLQDARHNRIDDARKRAELSEIFYWHRDEFLPNMQAFLAAHAPTETTRRRLLGPNWYFGYRAFDWSRNDADASPDPDPGGSPLLWVYLIPAGLLLLYGLHTFRSLLRRRALD